MAGPRPPRSIEELDAQLGENGEMLEPVIPVKTIKLEKPKKERTEYKFQMVGDFAKDAGNGTIRYPALSLSNSQLVWDEEKQTSRQARLLNGIPSIWQDEQDKLSEKFVVRNAPSLVFSGGILLVPATDKPKIKFLTLCSDFQGCEKPVVNRKARYKLLDTEKSEALEYEKKQRRREAVDLAWKADIAD